MQTPQSFSPGWRRRIKVRRVDLATPTDTDADADSAEGAPPARRTPRVTSSPAPRSKLSRPQPADRRARADQRIRDTAADADRTRARTRAGHRRLRVARCRRPAAAPDVAQPTPEGAAEQDVATPADVPSQRPVEAEPAPGRRRSEDETKTAPAELARRDHRRWKVRSTPPPTCPPIREGMDWFVLARGVEQGELRPGHAAPQGADRGAQRPARRPHHGADREDQDPQGRQDQDHRDEALPGLRLRGDAARDRRAHPAGRLLPDQGDDRRRRLRRHRRAARRPWRSTRSRRCSSTRGVPEEMPSKSRWSSSRATHVTHQRRAPSRTTRARWTKMHPGQGARARARVTIFGRQAPIELEYWQIAKATE